MNQAARRKKREQFWQNVDPSQRGYGNAIDMLLDMLTGEQLEEAVALISGKESRRNGSAKRIIRLPVSRIVLRLDGTGGGTITSDLHEACPCGNQADCCLDCDGSKAACAPESEEEARSRIEFNMAMDGVESLVLAHACAGVDVEAEAYIEGLETALNACGNELSD
jgi:hypothetical protein